MGKLLTNSKSIIVFHSKLLSFSLFYLFISLFLALYAISSKYKCILRSTPFDYPIQDPIFTYPYSYGEHKYAVSTTRSRCSSPANFSDYRNVLKEIQHFQMNSLPSSSSSSLGYMQGNADSFGGNLSTHLRFSYFDGRSDIREVPCGFFKKFPIKDSDQIAMEKCSSVVVVSAVFNDHDKIRQPRGLGSKTLENVCFFMFIDDVTLKVLEHHGLISRNSSEYVVAENADMAISKHPYFVHTIEEAMATARWRKWWDINALKMQMETYCENGLKPWSPKKLPFISDVPDSALILRKHGVRSNLFSCLIFNELDAFNPRDQLAFAFVRDHMNPKIKINMFEVEVFEQVTVEYRHNLKASDHRTTPKSTRKITKREKTGYLLHANGSCCGSCQHYVSAMWGVK
ncbi:hypothetical protein PIB30_009149 [Stylosanthes scabra]|uniref:TOD1/MUCI70 glycosyltransferase-like domain-containing protein n=1 Tax=Stylosanthes scabra TaxID=79078 RepID=A0ABU6X566_9FABA|nr:hypothetical protein [Stylosanthes scabra]